MTTFQTETIAKLREFAEKKENYNAGWDFLVECYTDEEILELFNGDTEEEVASMRAIFPDYEGQEPATTYTEAKRRVKAVMALQQERRREIESTIW